MDPEKGNDSKMRKREEVIHPYSKYNGEESHDEFIESTHIGIIEVKKEVFDEKESESCLEKSSYMNREARDFKNIQDESKDRYIDNVFDNDIMECCVIKKETNDVMEPCVIKNDVNEITVEELHYFQENLIKSEVIEQEEVQIKHEENNEDELQTEKILKAGKQTVLHQCPECPYSSTRKDNLKSHSIKHTKMDKINWFSCQECLYKTFRKENLRRHVEIHNNPNLILKCPICSYETLRSRQLKKHQIKHKTTLQELHCPECSFKTHQQYLLRNHMLAHKRDSFKCPNCPYQARKKELLTIHQFKHESIDKWHSCPLCPYKIYHKSMLKRHCQQRHCTDPNNPIQTEIFKCTECSYESGTKYKVKRHQLIHDRTSWLQCSDCDYKTPYKSSLKIHQVWHLGENAEGWHRCPECSYKTVHKQVLQKHIMSHKTTGEIQWFECLDCSFKTARKDYLRLHQLKHKEEHEIEWFFCYQCAFKTKQKSNLISHILSKHKKQIDKDYMRSSGK